MVGDNKMIPTSGKLATAVLGLVVQKLAPGLDDRILLG